VKKLNKPTFENKNHGEGAGIPVLKTIWDLFIAFILTNWNLQVLWCFGMAFSFSYVADFKHQVCLFLIEKAKMVREEF